MLSIRQNERNRCNRRRLVQFVRLSFSLTFLFLFSHAPKTCGVSATLAIKSSGRVEPLAKLLSSIKTHLPGFRILIVDDGPFSMQAELIKVLGPLSRNTAVLQMQYDAGLAAGRNALLDAITSDYMVYFDDDFIVTKNTNVCQMLEVLTRFPDLMMVGGIVSDRKDFGFRFNTDGVTLRQVTSEPFTMLKSCSIVDIVPNFFAGRMIKLRQVRWDNHFKLGEHEDFFFRAKRKGLKTISCKFSSVGHNSSTSWQRAATSQYEKRRKRAWHYQQQFLQKHNLMRYETHTGQLIMSNERLLMERRSKEVQTRAAELMSWIETNRISVILMSWKRRENILRIIDTISKNSGLVREIIIWNNHKVKYSWPREKRGMNIQIYDSPRNVNTLGRWKACAKIAKGPLCFFIDDDFHPTMLRQLFFSYERRPGLLHAATNARVAWNNRRWSVEDVAKGIHTSFSWVGSGAIIPRESAQRFLKQLSVLKQVDFDVCDNMFAYLTNEHPVLMLAKLEQTGLSERNAFSRGTKVLKRLSSARRHALIGLMEHVDEWFPNRTFVSKVQPIEAIEHAGNFVVVSDATHYATTGSSDLRELPRHFTDDYVNDIHEAAEHSESFQASVEYGLLNAVDGKKDTYWRSTSITRGMYVLIDLMKIDDVGTVHVLASDGFFDLSVHLSFDGIRWDAFNFQNRMNFIEEKDNTRLARSCLMNLTGFKSRYVRFTAEWDSAPLQIWEMRLD